MENLFFLRFEIIILVVSLSYIFYYLWENIKEFYLRITNVVRNPKRKKQTETAVQTPQAIIDEYEEEIIPETAHREEEYLPEETTVISGEDKLRITDILKKEALYYERGDYVKAKALVIEGLALDKNHKQLNLELASIYNKEGDYKKSEYIYRELIENQEDDYELLKKLGFVLALQKKYKDSVRVYKEAHEKKPSDSGVIDILGELLFEVEDFEGSIKFLKMFLREKPRDVEKLQLLAYAYDNMRDVKNAITYYQRILEMQPYNTDVKQRVTTLETLGEEGYPALPDNPLTEEKLEHDAELLTNSSQK